MHILRWLMKHPIMLAWLLAIIAILLNFSMVNKSGEEQVEHAAAPEATTEHAQTVEAVPAAAATGEQAPAPAATEQVATGSAEQAPAETNTAGTQVAMPTPPAAPEAPAAPVAPEMPVVPEAPVQPAAPTPPAVPASASEQAAPAAGEQAAASPSSEADLLRAAREAYWSNELDNAVGFYTSLLEKKPDSLDYKGELANVYWKQGNAKQAAELFTEIAPKLAAQGRVTEAFNMKLYVDMVDPELASKIDAALK